MDALNPQSTKASHTKKHVTSFSKHAYSNEQRHLNFYVYFYTFFSNTIPYNTVGYAEIISQVIIRHEISSVCTKTLKIAPQLTLCF